ncbi:nucleotide pyrophosphohydrolase [Bacteroidota bacterium]
MTIEEAQKRGNEWINKHGVRYFEELTNLALLMEEVGELARLMATVYGEQSTKEEEINESIPDEMADVLFVLICLANQTGVNFTNALINNLDKKTKRDQNRHRNNEKLQ